MPIYDLRWTDRASEDTERLPPGHRDQVLLDLWTLPDAPVPHGARIKKLRGFSPPLYRLRAGDYRILYRIEGQTVFVLRIIPRSLLDRILATLR